MKTGAKIVSVLALLALHSACLADELYVPDDYNTIQAAIDAAHHGDTVIVANGTYTGEGNRDIYLAKTVTVRSESAPENTIIDCNGSPGNRHRAFNFHTTADVTPALDGLTITNGYASGGNGGAIYAYRTDFTINNCIFTRNSGDKTVGGAIYCAYRYGDYGSPRITNCTFTANSANYGAAMYFRNAAPIIDNCVITDNRARPDDGGGIDARSSTVAITNCVITGNSAHNGGGISARDSTVTITNCSILSNSADYGGGGIDYHSYSWDGEESLTITNSVIAGNSAQNQDGWYAAGIFCYNRYGTAIIANSTITENCPAGIYCHGPIEITNCILWANSPEQIYYDGEYRPTVTYSDVQGAWSGEGNINADPRFVRPGESGPYRVEGDYHLLPTSPCIDTGDPNYLPEPNKTDLDGNPRVIDGDQDGIDVVDMGAYEFWPAVEARMKLTPQTLNCASNGKFIKAHITLPEEIFPEDIDINTPAVADPPDIDSEYIKILGGDSAPVRLEITFDRRAFCAELTEPGQIEITVTGFLTTGQAFYATDTITVKEPPAIRKSIKQAQTRRLRRNNKSIINFERKEK